MSKVCLSSNDSKLIDMIREQTGETNPDTLKKHAQAVAEVNGCKDTNAPLQPFTPIIIPDNDDVSSLNNGETQAQTKLKLMPTDQRAVLYDTLGELEPEEVINLLAILDFLEKNQSILSDLNTYNGGGIAAVTSRSNKFHQAIKELDQLLMQGAKASPNQKPLLRTQIKSAYAKMNQQFATEIKLLTQKNGYVNRYHPLIKQRQGWKIANKLAKRGRSMPLLNHADTPKLMRIMSSAKWVGRGVLVLDLVSRGYTIYNSSNPQRAFLRESMGLGLSTGFAWGVYALSSSALLLLGPWGLVLLLIVAGAAAVAGDYAGKGLFDTLETNVYRPLMVVQ